MNRERVLQALESMHNKEGILFTSKEDAEEYWGNLTDLIMGLIIENNNPLIDLLHRMMEDIGRLTVL